MAESAHQGDAKSILYLNVLAEGQPLDDALGDYPTRTVYIKPPTGAVRTIAGPVAIETDATDNIDKLKLVSGPLAGGNDVELDLVGTWQAQVLLADGAGGSWKSDIVDLVQVQTNLA